MNQTFQNIQRILVIKFRYIGDVVLSTPTLQLIREAYPKSKISVLTSTEYQPIYQGNPFIDQIWTLPIPEIRKIKVIRKMAFYLYFIKRLMKERFDLVIDLDFGDRGAIVSYLTRAPYRVGLLQGWKKCLFTHGVCLERDRHMTSYLAEITRPVGIEPRNIPLTLLVDIEERTKMEILLKKRGVQAGSLKVVVHPTARWESRMWPKEHFAILCDALIEQHHATIIFISGAGEQDLSIVHWITSKIKHQTIDLGGALTLSESAALISMADLFIGHNSGPMHMASALGVFVVALFGSDKAERTLWGPWTTRKRVIYNTDVECVPCDTPQCLRAPLGCLAGLTPDKVLSVLNEVMLDIFVGRDVQ